MVFSSPLFLFLFLPLVLGIHFLAPRRLRNTVLLLSSLLFYGWGEPTFLLVMLASVAANYLLGLWVDGARGGSGATAALVLTVVANIGILGVYKYGNFAVENLNAILSFTSLPPLRVARIALPIGISFFTFQAMSYVLDVHRKRAQVQRNPLRVALYVSLYPQLIAGPIVRYQDVADQIDRRAIDLAGFAYGVRRFIVGLGKKVLVANTVALPADQIFALPASELHASLAWTAVLCYTLQIYFDFSGYSDMAIGLGRMIGFRFLENFNYPYVSASVREFWRRWHISLSTWFRDYLYLPLGGSRVSPLRTHVNLVIVFFLCGLWHGASWTFVCWGLYHGLFLVAERLRGGRWLERLPLALRHGYLLLVVMVGWVLFRAETLHGAAAMLRAMAGAGSGTPFRQPLLLFVTPDVFLALAGGIIGSMPWLPVVARYLAGLRTAVVTAMVEVASFALLAAIFLASAMLLSAQTHNPFIYYRF